MDFARFKHRFGFRPDYFKESRQVIEYAFTCGGIDYYQHTDEMNMPFRRALKALTFYKELDMNCDRAYLESHIMAMDTLFSGKKIGFDEMSKMKRLNEQLKERVQWIATGEHLYRIASVRFFDRHENPEDYDYKYNEKKMAHWKKSEGMNDFFLRAPIVKLLPFLKSAPPDLESYSAVAAEMTRAHLDYLWQLLSPAQKTELQNSTAIPSLEAILHQKP